MGVQERWECGRRGGSAGGEMGVLGEVGVWEERWECGRRDESARRGRSVGGETAKSLMT